MGWTASDKLNIATLDANTSAAGNQDFTFIESGSASNYLSRGQVKFYHDSGNTFVVLNQNADTLADLQIFIAGIHTLTEDNFVGIV